MGLLWATVWVGRSVCAGSCFCGSSHGSVCVRNTANVPHVCLQSTGIHLRMRSFYLSHTVAEAIHTFYITVLLELRIGVWDLMSFISESSLAAALWTSHAIKHHLLQMLLGRPRHLNSCCCNTGFGSFIIPGFFCRFPAWIQDGVWWKQQQDKLIYMAGSLSLILSETKTTRNPLEALKNIK